MSKKMKEEKSKVIVEKMAGLAGGQRNIGHKTRESLKRRHTEIIAGLKETAKEPTKRWAVAALGKYRDQLEKKIRVRWEVITPRDAAEMLDHNTRNRMPKLGLQARIVRDMKNENWHANGESIIFAKDGTLVDGQNRLMACLLADTPFVALVVRGVDTDSFKSVDTGLSRSHGDALKINSGVRNANNVANALAILWRWKNRDGVAWRDWEGNYPTRDEMVEMWAAHPEIEEMVASFRMGKKVRAGFPSGVLAAAKFLFMKKDPQLAEVFFDSLVSGLNLRRHDPVYLIREKLLREKMVGGGLSQKDIFYLLVRAWNATRTGEELQRLTFPKGTVYSIDIE